MGVVTVCAFPVSLGDRVSCAASNFFHPCPSPALVLCVLADPACLAADDLLTSIRTQVALQLTVPYTRVSISHIAGELSVSSQEAESLLVSLILDGKLAATIDQPNQILVVTGSVGDRSQATPTTTGTTATGKANPSGANLLASASASSSSAASSSSSAAGASKSASSGISGGGSGGGFAAKYLELAGLANRVGRLVSTLTAAPVSQIGLAHFD